MFHMLSSYQDGPMPLQVDTSWILRGKQISFTRYEIDYEPPTPRLVAWETCNKNPIRRQEKHMFFPEDLPSHQPIEQSRLMFGC